MCIAFPFDQRAPGVVMLPELIKCPASEALLQKFKNAQKPGKI